MKFGISQESNLGMEKNSIVIDLSNDLEDYFSSKTYGKGIDCFYIGLICVRPEFDFFFKIRKPKFEISKKLIPETKRHENLKISGTEKVLGYDIKLDYESFVKASIDENKKMLSSAILKSVHELKLPSKVKDFNKEKFELDLRNYLEEYTNT